MKGTFLDAERILLGNFEGLMRMNLFFSCREAGAHLTC